MLKFVKNIWDWLLSFWRGLDRKTKEKIVVVFVEKLGGVLAEYYRSRKEKDRENGNDAR